MSKRRLHTHRLAFLAGLYIFVQALALGHSAAHADQPHKHYGVTCQLKVVAQDQAILPTFDTLPPALPAPEIAQTSFYIEAPRWSRPPGRAPPPRSPPSLQQ
ncbi:hypothetical protein [Hyphomonas pacifica]|uniref:hypothetical protein n=1 Tax=Hyphomonas pacifica TaxID=1280941 RepID=UPI000DC017C4|nr:hypothetical protein [Hyphomonas pacifica]RAN38120.1 hypothetical protein HY11_07600 [Hyphomonas pacifica]